MGLSIVNGKQFDLNDRLKTKNNLGPERNKLVNKLVGLYTVETVPRESPTFLSESLFDGCFTEFAGSSTIMRYRQSRVRARVYDEHLTTWWAGLMLCNDRQIDFGQFNSFLSVLAVIKRVTRTVDQKK